jgi:prevent-host-death family protein
VKTTVILTFFALDGDRLTKMTILINIINMTNITIPATKAKTEFGKLIDAARTQPVSITRNGRSVAVIISPEEYNKLLATDDAYWCNEAEKAKGGGLLGKKKSSEFISSVLNS